MCVCVCVCARARARAYVCPPTGKENQTNESIPYLHLRKKSVQKLVSATRDVTNVTVVTGKMTQEREHRQHALSAGVEEGVDATVKLLDVQNEV